MTKKVKELLGQRDWWKEEGRDHWRGTEGGREKGKE